MSIVRCPATGNGCAVVSCVRLLSCRAVDDYFIDRRTELWMQCKEVGPPDYRDEIEWIKYVREENAR